MRSGQRYEKPDRNPNGLAPPLSQCAPLASHVRCRVPRSASPDMQHPTCNMQHATCNMQHATCNMQLATCNMQHATCNIHATCNMQHSTCDQVSLGSDHDYQTLWYCG